MFLRTSMIFAALCSVSLAAVHSGRATADWLSTSKTYEAGKPIQTALRLVVDQGWHTYWTNPGEGGMKISVTWELPTGWTAGELQHPVPKRFTTGELAGFGYEGTVVFPVTFTAPADSKGAVKLKGQVSWLTCNKDQCLPGNAELELSLDAGPPAATAEAKAIDAALLSVPSTHVAGLNLSVTENAGVLSLKIEAEPGNTLNLDDYEIFPATPQIVDPVTKIQFTKSGIVWSAQVPKSEYAMKPVKEITLVFAGKSGQAPMALTWNSK